MKSAVIGLGVIGTVHAGILCNTQSGLSAVCDVDESRFQGFAGIPQYTDFRRMLDEIKPDIVHVCTPHYLHADMIVSALERGVNVLCEKPLCIRKEDIPRILGAEKRSRAQLGVCLQNRYNAANRYVKQFLEECKAICATGNVVWHRDAAYYASGEWRGKRKTEGGGVLVNQAIHTLDLLQWFLGMPKYVTALTGNLTLRGEIEVEDTVSALYSGGAEFSLFATNGSAEGFPVGIAVRTEEESISVAPDCVTVGGKTVSFDRDTRVFGKYCYGTGHERLIADFYDCVQSGRKFLVDGAEGAKSVRLVLGAYESGGRRVGV